VVEGDWWPDAMPPLEGATVAFDAPDGDRIERESGPDGTVTFEGIDWSLGTASATAFLEGYALYSATDLHADTMGEEHLIDGAVPLVLQAPAKPPVEQVTVRGTVTGLLDDSHYCWVSVAQCDNGDEVDGPAEVACTSELQFTVAVPRGAPFVLQAIENGGRQELPSGQGFDVALFQVAQKSFDALDADATGVVLDFAADGLETFTTERSIELPTRADSPVRDGWPYFYFCAREAYYCTGWPTHVDVSADGNQFDVSFLWVAPDWIEHPDVYTAIFDGGWEEPRISYQFTDGDPSTAEFERFIDSPAWISPASPTDPHPLHTPFEWESFDERATHALLTVRSGPLAEGEATLWVVRPGPGRTTVTVPAAPSTVDEAELLGSHQEVELTVGVFDWALNDFRDGGTAEHIIVP
jgi:hypothetical protein